MFFTRPRKTRPAVATRRRGVSWHPQLEWLEDRTVPASFTVNTPLDVLGHDGGQLSIRQAIIDANATQGHNTITLPAGYSELALAGGGEDDGATGDLDIYGDLTISTISGDFAEINAAGLDRIFEVFGGKLDVSSVGISGGRASPGGGILNHGGTVTLTHCFVGFNTAIADAGTGDASRGAIASLGGSLTLSHCDVRRNEASTFVGDARGGDIYAVGSAVSVTHTTFDKGFITAFGQDVAQGGRIYAADSSLSITSSTLYGGFAFANTGLAQGGSIYVGDSTLNFTGSTIVVDRSGGGGFLPEAGGAVGGQGGGIYAAGSTVTVTSSLISAIVRGESYGQGGGIYAVDSTLTVSGNSELSGSANGGNGQGGAIYTANSAVSVANSILWFSNANGQLGQGGVIYGASSTIAVANSLILQGSATGSVVQGGGIYVLGSTLTLTKTDLTDNHADGGDGGGIYASHSTVTILRSELSDNTADLGGAIFLEDGILVIKKVSFSGNDATTAGDNIFTAP